MRFTLSLVAALILAADAMPPWGGTVWITPNILTDGDPSSLDRVTYTGRGMRDYWDGKTVVTVEAYLFDAVYGGHRIEFRAHPDYGSREAAQEEVDRYAHILGRLPMVLLTGSHAAELGTVVGGFAGGTEGIYIMDSIDGLKQIDNGFIEEILIHEGGHTSLDRFHADSPDWLAAQEVDGNFISTYARDNPNREDIAETFINWFAVRYKPERVTSHYLNTTLDTVPNRLAYFDEQNFDMSPYTLAPTSVPALPFLIWFEDWLRRDRVER